jgi:hypothetical protein
MPDIIGSPESSGFSLLAPNSNSVRSSPRRKIKLIGGFECLRRIVYLGFSKSPDETKNG